MHFATDTLIKMKDVWDDIGLESEERKKRLQKLANDTNFIFINALKQEEEYRDNIKEKIGTGLQRICKICTALGETVQLVLTQ